MNSNRHLQREERVAQLRRTCPTDRVLRWSGVVVLGLVIWAWSTAGPLLGRLPADRRWQNLLDFLGQLVPKPVRESGNWLEAFPWAWELLRDGGASAFFVTLGIACASIILAGAVVLSFLPLASRELGRPGPFRVHAGEIPRWRRRLWRVVGSVTRGFFVVTRSIPEYILAFLLLSLLGLQVWPLVLALAIHNFGILGRLWGEVVENADSSAAERAVSAGMGRFQVFGVVLLPAVFNRFLIYFFYRWETCVKDATVLGMLGILTLGKLIALSKGFFWDEMFFYVLLGASVILVGDFFSALLRRRLREA